MKINVNKVLKRDAEKKQEVKPPPKVVVIGHRSGLGTRSGVAARILEETSPEIRQNVHEHFDGLVKDSVLKSLWEEMSAIKTERGKLSTRTAYLVTEVAQKLLQESQAMAQAFMDGELPEPEIAAHYAKIEALTDRAIAVWDKIKYVEQYGKLPTDPEATAALLEEDSQEASVLHHQIRRLDDRIHKTKKKLAGKVPKNPSRVAMWKQKLALDEAQRDELKRKLKNVQYGARAERTG